MFLVLFLIILCAQPHLHFDKWGSTYVLKTLTNEFCVSFESAQITSPIYGLMFAFYIFSYHQNLVKTQHLDCTEINSKEHYSWI